MLIYTEFGRRVGGNASNGTDHGWANVAFVAGPSVKGGFYGEPPSLTKLSEGNTVYTTDFRSLYATMLGQVLGATPSPSSTGRSAALAGLNLSPNWATTAGADACGGGTTRQDGVAAFVHHAAVEQTAAGGSEWHEAIGLDVKLRL